MEGGIIGRRNVHHCIIKVNEEYAPSADIAVFAHMALQREGYKLGSS